MPLKFHFFEILNSSLSHYLCHGCPRVVTQPQNSLWNVYLKLCITQNLVLNQLQKTVCYGIDLFDTILKQNLQSELNVLHEELWNYMPYACK